MKYFPTTARALHEHPLRFGFGAIARPSSMAFSPPAPKASRPSIANHYEAAIPSSRILVVDDDAGVRNVLEKILSGTGYCVRCADDGEAGWAALNAGCFDLLITDHAMPRLTGLNLLRRMRAVPLGLPSILLSGEMPWDEADLLELIQPGMAMEKPFSFIELLANVRSLLNRTACAESVVAGQAGVGHQPVPCVSRGMA